MDELARSRRGARRPVTGLHERGVQATRDGIDSRTRPDDAATDDEHVELTPVAHRGERRPTLSWSEPSGHMASHLFQTLCPSSLRGSGDLCRPAGSRSIALSSYNDISLTGLEQ